MPELVTVAEKIHERQGFKVVQTADGGVKEVPPGEAPELGELLLARYGDPNFQVRLGSAVQSVADLPGEVALALDRVAERLCRVTPDGREVPNDDTHRVEQVVSAVQDGAIVLGLDLDDSGCTRQMIDAMVRILLEELVPQGVAATISVAPPSDG